MNIIYKSFDYKPPEGFKDWSIKPCFTDNWENSNKRILFVFDHVLSNDIRNNKLLSSATYKKMIGNLWNYSWMILDSWGYEGNKFEWAIGFVNWRNCKTYDIKDTTIRDNTEKYFKERLKTFIKQYRPTHIHYFGETSAKIMHKLNTWERGWIKGKSIKYSFNLNMNQYIIMEKTEDDWKEYVPPDKANLWGHIGENIAKLIYGGYPFSLNHIKVKYKFISNMKKWKLLLEKLWKTKRFAYDLETKNLTIYKNGIVTAQFTLEGEQDISYIVPLKSIGSPWNAKEFKEIYRDLRKLFSRKFDHEDWNIPYIIGQNIGFDIRVTRVELGIPIIYYRLWDCMAGEYCLNENDKGLPTESINDVEQNRKSRPWALDAIFARYENDFYYTAEFSKEHRANISNIKLKKPVLEYAAMDTISVFAIHRMQKKRAESMGFLEYFMKLMLGLWSDTTHVISHMVESGSPIDREYIYKQYATDTSDIEKERDKLLKKLYNSPSVIKTNKLLNDSVISGSLFDGTEYSNTWQFDIRKDDHKDKLFFEVMNLNPINITDTGKRSIDKEFKKTYSDKSSNNYYKEVDLFTAIEETVKVRGYIKNYYNKINEPDGLLSNCIHASYGFLMVVTGRSNSFDPNLQNIPNHGVYAKMVKRAFISRPGRIRLKLDYATHEIACWCQESGDKVLANVFKTIQDAHDKFRKNPTEDNRESMEKLDLHKLNYTMFTGMKLEDIESSHRQQSKNIVFGAMYGQTVHTTASILGIELDKMEEIYNSFFGKFRQARKYLDNAVKKARKYYYTENNFGFRRHLTGHLTAVSRTQKAMDRRAQNSSIQGYASQIAFVAARLLTLKIHEKFYEKGLYGKPVWDKEQARYTIKKPEFDLCAMVHDSTEVEVSYELFNIVANIMEESFTKGVVKYTNKMYGIDWCITPRIDMEMYVKGDNIMKWDFTKKGLGRILKSIAKTKKEQGEKISYKSLLKKVEGNTFHV